MVPIECLLKPVKRSGMRVVAYVGTFDPVHEGHVDAARKCLASGADEVLLIPKQGCGRKEAVLGQRERMELCCKRVVNEEGMNVFMGDCSEYMPRAGEPWSLQRLLEMVKGLYGAADVGELCGTDALASFPPSANLEYFFGQTLYVATRPPYPYIPTPNAVEIGTTANISSTLIREALRRGAPLSTLIDLGLHKRVLHHITENSFYR
eukprot:TRINITY_DN789_c0_g1_i1.p1 TRINITY_DN789_c0_g1~~TRINITY_DN789_c0_g1_i1.p1  ORF type:complete len:207 (+),score=29.61 TRINITY_DN789_c0_g1_i1:37-657(+)